MQSLKVEGLTMLSAEVNRTACSSPVIGSVSSQNSFCCDSHHGLHSAKISEIPPGLYEFLIGDNGEAKILCKICQYVSNKKSNFKRHFTNMHFVHDEESAKVLECCGIRFKTKGDKFQHTKSVHKAGYRCSICTKVFDRPALLQRHLAKHTGKKPYKCSLCSYQTPNKANAKRHIEKKHSTVQEGSILFVTEDGEQIQMETVSKTCKDNMESGAGVVKSSADSSTSFGNSSSKNSSPNSSFTSLPRSPSARVTSTISPTSSSTSVAHLFTGGICDVQGLCVDGLKRRQISHSVDMILGSQKELFPRAEIVRHQGNVHPMQPESRVETSPTSSSNQRSEERMSKHCSPNSSQTSSLHLSFSCNDHPQSHLPNTCHGAYATAFKFSFLLRQCAHGCWHVDNHVSSDSSQHPLQAGEAFASFTNSDPDLRSFPYLSQIENSSTTSVKSEHDDDDDDDSSFIDVVGDSENSSVPLLNTICQDLGSVRTDDRSGEAGIAQDIETFQMNCIVGPPVESTPSGNSYSSSSSDNSTSNESQSDSEEYIPKKLRVSRAYVK